MDLNKIISKVGSSIVTVTVFLFALFLMINFPTGYFFVCLILPIGFIMLVYFAQLTTVKNELLNEQAANLLVFGKFGLIFNYDLLGYGVMALSTFFTGLSMKPKNKTDKWPRALMLIHGVFYFSCTFMPMTGMFAKMSSGGDGVGGRLALVVWCVYFLPIGILSFIHFKKDGMRYEKR